MKERDLQTLLIRVNQYRQKGEISDESQSLEAELEASYQCSHHLVVYGTLAPGRVNHHIVEHIAGIWKSDVYVEGEFVGSGWAVELGYPMIRWKPGGSRVASYLLTSEMLPSCWTDLDHFEGPEYCRILIPSIANVVRFPIYEIGLYFFDVENNNVKTQEWE
ncbi:gamma-glutamylcyclotransferase [bacterium]|nr:gamma-glutamylcyclotransferase [bacterium]